jgi:drug/metabolite transporter (DMT)-like permease
MRARVVWVVLCGIWGSTWLFIKLGLRDLPPVSFAGMRFVIASALLFGVAAMRKSRLPRSGRDWAMIAATGVLAFTINYGLLFWGEQHVSSGLAAILQAMIPAFGLVIAHYLLPSERITPARASGVVIGLVGIGVIFSNQFGTEGPLALWGSAAIVFGSFAAALSNVLVKSRGGHIDPSVLAAGQMACGLVPLVVYGAVRDGSPLAFHWTPLAVVSLVYLAIVGSSVAFFLYYWLVRHMDVTTTMLIALVTPVIAVLVGFFAADERLSWRTLAGGLLILSGIALVNFRFPRLKVS